MSPEPRGRKHERLARAPGKRGGPETHLRALSSSELRQAGRILGVPIGSNVREAIPRLVAAIRANPNSVRLLRDAGLAGLVGSLLAMEASSDRDAEARDLAAATQ